MRGTIKDSPQDLSILGVTGEFEKFEAAVIKTEQELCSVSDLRRMAHALRPVPLGFPLASVLLVNYPTLSFHAGHLFPKVH